ncbi:predicted protein [Botrytis cinerea T4]|uniref:Uncharacterized protein n=1 Tax=Botryotinia fuckeliana (strain T4) TaxID=999810 RepID=G2YN11_BOTF4|nr:predicted protein [Botrytis cinerea T4]
MAPRSTYIIQFCVIVGVDIAKTNISHFESEGEKENATPKLEIDGPSIISDLWFCRKIGASLSSLLSFERFPKQNLPSSIL